MRCPAFRQPRSGPFEEIVTKRWSGPSLGPRSDGSPRPNRLAAADEFAYAMRGWCSFLSILAVLTVVLTGCGSSDGRVTSRAEACLGCHPAESLTQVAVAGPARSVVDALSDGFPEEVGARRPFPRRGAHSAEDLEACATCHVGHTGANDFAQNQNIYPQPALAALHEPGADCAGGCHNWLAEPIFEVGFQNLFGDLPYDNGDLDPYRLLLDSSYAGFNNLVTRATTPGHKTILTAGWDRAPNEETLFPFHADHYAAGCGGCHDLSGEQRHGETPSCNDCHVLTRENPPDRHGRYSTHEYLIDGITLLRPLGAPGQLARPVCEFCHKDPNATVSADPVERRICYNCHLSAHQVLRKPYVLSFWEALPVGEKTDEVLAKKAAFDQAHSQ